MTTPLRLWLLVMACVVGLRARAEALIDPQSERLMEFVLHDNSLLNESLVIYPSLDDWLFPLGETSRSLSIAVQVSPKTGQAEGFVAEPFRRFRLDTNNCRVDHNGRSETYPCDLAFLYEDEIYVHRVLLERWYQLGVSVLPLRSQVIVTPRLKLPIQARLERERLASRQKGQKTEYDPGYPRQPIPRSLVDGFFLEEQLSVNYKAQPGYSTRTLQHTTQFAGEVLGFETTSLLTGSHRHLDAIRFSMARLAGTQEAALFGPFKIREFRLFDVTLPPLPLIANSSTGRGLFVSTFPVDRPVTFETADFQGPLAPGWEVVLYRNDVLIDRQVADTEGRYFFRQVPLLYGRNLFRLSFFGPQGERRDEYRNYTISPELLVPGDRNYRIGLSRLDDGRQHYLLDYYQNFAKYFSFQSGLFRDQSAARTYGYLGLSGVNELFLFTANCAFASDGGKACEWGSQFGIENLSLGGRYTRLFDFRSDRFNRDALVLQNSQLAANLSYFFPTNPGVTINLEYTNRHFVNDTGNHLLTNRLAVGGGQVFFNNELNYEFGAPIPVTGTWEIAYVPQGPRYILDATYNLRRVLSVGAGVQITRNRDYNFLGNLRYDLVTRTPVLSAALSKVFPQISVGLNATTDFRRTHTAGALFAFGAVFDVGAGKVSLRRPPVTSQGFAAARLFKDANGNDRHDPGEETLAGAQILVGERPSLPATDEDGYALVPDLRPHFPADLSVAPDSLVNDPFLRPGVPGYRVYPRAGKLARVDLPVRVVGETDGYVNFRAPGAAPQPLRGVVVQIFDGQGRRVTEAKTDEEGFFTVSDLKPGPYVVRPDPAQLRTNGLRAEPEQRQFRIPPEGAFVSLEEFLLTPR